MALINLVTKLGDDHLKDLVVELTTLGKLIDQVIQTQKKTNEEIRKIQTSIDAKVHEELDTIQRRYITMLEGKMVKFDNEANELRQERERNFQKLHGYFYSGGRP